MQMLNQSFLVIAIVFLTEVATAYARASGSDGRLVLAGGIILLITGYIALILNAAWGHVEGRVGGGK